MSNYSDEQLMFSLIEEGDLGSFEELLTRYEKPLLLYIVRQVGDYHSAQDLFQETFYRIFKHRKSFNPDLRFSTWAYRIATNLCINALKEKSHELELFLEDINPGKASSSNPLNKGISTIYSQSSPEEESITKDLEGNLKALVNSLPEKLRSIFILSRYQELSHPEIAKILGIPLGTVKSRLRQSFEQLFELVEKRGLIDEL